VDLGEGTLSGLDERNAILRVPLSLIQAGDLSAHLLRDGEAGRVIGGTVDPVARRQLLHRLGRVRRRSRQVAVGVESLDVVLDAEGHVYVSLT
jgi:hypothetical protein